MKITRIETTEIPLDNEVTIEGVQIADEIYRLRVKQYPAGTGLKGLIFEFGDGDFYISIESSKKIRFERRVIRPYHDHDDMERLQVKEGEDKTFWAERFPYKGEGRELFEVDFGEVTVDY
jgi:hypothetical protein